MVYSCVHFVHVSSLVTSLSLYQGVLWGAARGRRHRALHQEAGRGGRRGVQVYSRVRLQPAARGQGWHFCLQWVDILNILCEIRKKSISLSFFNPARKQPFFNIQSYLNPFQQILSFQQIIRLLCSIVWRLFNNILQFSVGITWEDAPEVQYASLEQDYKVRCVVRANPPANIDWLKESLIISTGRQVSFFHPCLLLKHLSI